MKTSQWILAVVVLAGMVFAITFGMNYLGGSREGVSARPDDPGGLRLTFPVPQYPPNDGVLTCEYGPQGSCFFWFQNTNAKEVKLGLEKKSCKCTSVFVHLVPPEMPAAWASWTGTQTGMGAVPGGLLGAATVTAYQAVWAEDQLQHLGQGVELTDNNSRAIPPGALGAVQVSWKTERPGPAAHILSLWSDSRANTVITKLEARTNIVRPLEVEPSLDVGVLEDSQLPYTRNTFAYSSTRPSVNLTAQVIHDGRTPESDPFEVGQPVPASEEDIKKLRETLGAHNITVPLRSVYKVPVTLRAGSSKGSLPFELGAFRRYIELRSEDAGIEPQQVGVIGRVESMVTLSNAAPDGFVVFGQFSAAKGAEQKILLESDMQGLELAVDKSRIPGFLEEPKLELLEVSPGGHRSWRLVLRVAPGKAAGRFPNPADPSLRDCAVYLKTNEKQPRSIRIPLGGSANLS